MAKFFVRVKEIHESIIEVDATDGEAALNQVAINLDHGEYPDDFRTEYQRTMDKSDWIVEDEKGHIVGDDGRCVICTICE